MAETKLRPDVKPLPREFYLPSASKVAPLLLGHWLLRKTAQGYCGGPIVETEAYLENDPSCHAFPGETPRNKVMWGEPGISYVYLIYGFYFCFNAVCKPAGRAEAVLIRAVEADWDLEFMYEHRPVAANHHLTSGPGKLCVAMDIRKEMNGVDLCSMESPLIIAENPDVKKVRRNLGPVITTTRIGIRQAADWPLRFYLQGSQFISKRDKLKEQREG